MSRRLRNQGLTLIEVAIVMVVIGVLVGVSFSSLREWQRNERATAAARSIADLFRTAASEAVRSGSVHIVFLSISGSGDVVGNTLTDSDGNWAPILLLNDGPPGSAGQNCMIEPGEGIVSMPPTPGLGWGLTRAGATKAPGDATPIASTSGSSFATPAGAATTWVAFMPDGRPLGFDGTCSFGQLGSGNGAVYVTNGDRDFAIVLNALGGVRIHAWNENAGAWQG